MVVCYCFIGWNLRWWSGRGSVNCDDRRAHPISVTSDLANQRPCLNSSQYNFTNYFLTHSMRSNICSIQIKLCQQFHEGSSSSVKVDICSDESWIHMLAICWDFFGEFLDSSQVDRITFAVTSRCKFQYMENRSVDRMHAYANNCLQYQIPRGTNASRGQIHLMAVTIAYQNVACISLQAQLWAVWTGSPHDTIN